MNELRRKLLKGSSAATLLAPWIGTGLLLPGRVIAAEWNITAFTARNVNEALKAWGAANAAESRDIIIMAPVIAENGAKVEIDVTSQVPATRSIAIFADRNPMPLCAAIEFTGGALPYCRAQIKLAETTRVRVVVKAGDGKTYVAFREIKVTLGGCGG
jgi:sulfur-oxidizing protein SoxY